MTIISREHRFIFLRTRKTASSSIEIHLITQTDLGRDIYVTSREVLELGKAREKNSWSFVPRSVMGWYSPSKLVAKFRANIKGGGAILPKLQQHDSAKRVKALVGSRFFDSALKVTPVRNPWDAIISYYFWEKGGAQGRKKASSIDWTNWFNQKVLSAQEPDRVTKAENFLFDPWMRIDGIPVKLHFVYFEDIQSSLRKLAKIIGQPQKDFSNLSFHFKKTDRNRDYRPLYSDRQAEAVAKKFQGYLERTGYEFDRPGLVPSV